MLVSNIDAFTCTCSNTCTLICSFVTGIDIQQELTTVQTLLQEGLMVVCLLHTWSKSMSLDSLGTVSMRISDSENVPYEVRSPKTQINSFDTRILHSQRHNSLLDRKRVILLSHTSSHNAINEDIKLLSLHWWDLNVERQKCINVNDLLLLRLNAHSR